MKVFSFRTFSIIALATILTTQMSFTDKDNTQSFVSSKAKSTSDLPVNQQEPVQITRALLAAARVIVNAAVEVSVEYTPEVLHVTAHLAAVQPKITMQFADVNVNKSIKLKSLD